jgi:HD-GYP domain-containing protein (c-di-GMP phosphodiesterase class II)
MSFQDAVKRINELRGHALDEDVVGAFNRACREGVIRLRRDSDTERAEPVLAVRYEEDLTVGAQ